MSLEFHNAVWKCSPYEGTQLLIHLAMADMANEYGRFYVSQVTLAERCRCSVEYVRKTTKDMVGRGLLAVERKGHSHGKATEYVLRLPNTVTPQQSYSPTAPATNLAISYKPISSSAVSPNGLTSNELALRAEKSTIEEEYVEMPWPGLDDTPQPKSKSQLRRFAVEDEAGAVGKLPEDKREMRQAKYGAKAATAAPGRHDKPESEWSTKDIVAEFYALVEEHAPGVPSQVNAEQFSKWINRQVGLGVPRESILRAVRRFFNDPRVIASPGVGKPLWRRFLAFYPTVHGLVNRPSTDIDQKTLDMSARSVAKFLSEMED